MQIHTKFPPCWKSMQDVPEGEVIGWDRDYMQITGSCVPKHFLAGMVKRMFAQTFVGGGASFVVVCLF